MNAVGAAKSNASFGLRLDDQKLSQLLDQLDATSKETRKAKRYPYRHKSLPIELRVQGGQTLSVRAPSRNISATGLAFLHSGYVHPGTQCRIQLVTIHNNWETVDGAVIRCDYVEGRVHDVGVGFDKPIEVSSFASGVVPRRVLLVDDEPMIVRLVSHFLEQLNTQVTTATNGKECIEAATSSVFDVLLLDVEMPVLDGAAAIKQLRKDGYQGMAVAMTALSAPGDRERLLQAGFNRYLAKPLTQEILADLLDTLDEEPLFSSLPGADGMDELITQFVRDLAERVRGLEQAMAQKDLQYAQQIARQIKGEAGGYGFEPITAIAQRVETAAREASSFESVEAQIRGLVKLCSLARAPTLQQASAKQEAPAS